MNKSTLSPLKIKYAMRMNTMKASEIRELLKVAESPDIISFAGGLPAPELFPTERLAQIMSQLIHQNGSSVLQYGATEGYFPLREKIAKRSNLNNGTELTAENVLITSGSQQGIDLTGKLFIDSDDVIFCESPTYLAAINAFRAYRPTFKEIATDDDGILTDELESAFQKTPHVKFIYVIPDFHNPTGRTWSLERRKAFMELVKRYAVVVIEDNPYGELRFRGNRLPSLKSMDKNGQVIQLGTFSKIMCPGLRIGWIAADTEILKKYVLIKQGVDLHTCTLNQRCIDQYMEKYNIDEDVVQIKAVYQKRCDMMIRAIKEFFPGYVRHTNPEGGMFLWCELPEHVNTYELLERCLQKKVAFVPGSSFFPRGGHTNTLRLNFSNMPEEKIWEGIMRMGEAIID